MAALRMTRLSRYVQGQLVLPTLIGMLLFTFVLLMNQLFFIAQKVITLGLGWEITGRMLLYQLPRVLVMTIPMGTLLGCLIAVGRLSADHEWIAIQSAGRGPGALLRPVALHGLLATFVCLAVYLVVFPRTNFAARELSRDLLFTSRMGSELRPRVFYTDLPGTVLFVDEIRAGSQGRLEGVIIHRAAATGGFDELIVARGGDLYPSPDRSGRVEMDLRDGVLHAYRSDRPESYRVFRFGHYHLKLDPPPLLAAFQGSSLSKTSVDMNLPELMHELGEVRHQAVPAVRELRARLLTQEIHQRFALPSSALLFAILAVPLGVTRVRSGKGAGFALAILVIALYYVLFTTSRSLGSEGHLPVALGVWTANAVLVVWIAVALWRLRHSGPARESILVRWGFGLLHLLKRGSRATQPVADEPPPSSGSTAGWVSLVDRHVGLHYLRILGLALAGTYLVYAIVELKDLLDGTIENHKPLSLMLEYFEYLTPGMFILVLPIACLVAAVVAFTLLARNGELTAVLSSGMSLRRATLPVVLITVALCGVFFLVQDRIAPLSNQKAQQIKDDILARSPRTYGLSPGGRWTLGSHGHLYHYRLYDPAAEAFQGLSVFTIDLQGLRIVDHRFAVSARWDGKAWVLGDGWYRSFQGDGSGSYERLAAGERLALDPPENFARRELSLTARGDLTEQMSLLELRHQIATLRNSGYDTARLRVDYFAKLSQPFNPLVMVLLGLPFAFRIGRRGSLYGLGVALLLVIVYWATFAVFLALGREALLPPLLAAWAPNILYGLLSLYLILHVRT